MALKVLIVDDDMVMRTSLKTLIDWENNGYVICGDVANGSAAIAFMNKCQPDIVITDMNMPVMDGVALIEYLQENMPHVKIIALSGYDDFDYVRQSMKKGAIDYLLKHKLTADVLLEVLNTARASIMKERREMDDRRFRQEILESATDIIRHTFVTKLIEGEYPDEESIAAELKYAGLDINLRNLVVVAVEIDDYPFLKEKYKPKDLSRLIKTFMDLSGNILAESGRGFIEHVNDGDFIIIFSFGFSASTLFVSNRVMNDISRIKTSIKRYLNITASFGVSKLVPNIMDAGKAYSEAKELLKDKFYMGKDRVFTHEPIKTSNERYFSLELKEEKKIILLAKFQKKDELKEFINGLFDEMKRQNVGHNYVQMVTAELVNIARRVARETGVDSTGLFAKALHDIAKYETADDIRCWVLDIFDRLVQAIEMRDIRGNYSDITLKAIKYITENYNRNISLNDAAEYSGVSSTYLSRVFKEDTGKGFVEYLNSFRIEKAKILIQSGDIVIKEIYSDLGFNNYNYFFKVFKEYVGMTPNEYEESLKINA